MEQNLTVWLVRSKVKKIADGLFFSSRFMLSFISRLSSFYPFPGDLIPHIRELFVTLHF
jgi:hypothetical protein